MEFLKNQIWKHFLNMRQILFTHMNAIFLYIDILLYLLNLKINHLQLQIDTRTGSASRRYTCIVIV